MKSTFIINFFALILTVSVFSCKSDTKVALEPPSDTSLDSLSVMLLADPNDTSKESPFILPAAKNLSWKSWEAWFRACPANSTFKDHLVYLGPSSTKGLGYILSKDRKHDKIDFYKIIKDTSALKKFINPGVPVKQCDLNRISDFNMDFVINGNFLKTINAELGAEIDNARNISIKSGEWRIESIDEVPFMNYINSSKDPDIIAYRDALLDRRNVVLTKVLKVNGFSAEIQTNNKIGANLNATLQNGFDVNVIPIDESNKIGFKLNFKKTDSNRIAVTSVGEFSVFAQAFKGKKLE